MTKQRKPREFFADESSLGNAWNAGHIHYSDDPFIPKNAKSFRELNSQGIDEETVRKVCEWLKESSQHEESLGFSTWCAVNIESKFLGVKE